ncbi:Protein MGR2 [Sphaceloma murrayae]|uniref:Protein MGR2 n=1 Tax=Sphaceloma murrayae TaxID=2082308 RepID=A0A2K1QX80_9PEZI|nr:Protein MGR2 [Sphaceloma murrayae]
MPVPVAPGGVTGPSTFDKLKMGGLMGSTVGLILGFIFGATNIIRFGPGPNGMLRTLGQYMVGSAATFGFFMSIGMTIRTESSPIMTQAFIKAQAAQKSPLIMARRQLDNAGRAGREES